MENLKNKKILGIFVVIIVLIVGIGGKIYMDRQAFNDEMVSVVKSDEAKKVLEQVLKNLDPKALTSDGIIKSYEIDYSSIEHNPMGGIMLNIIVNDDSKLNVGYILNNGADNRLSSGVIEVSGELDELLEANK